MKKLVLAVLALVGVWSVNSTVNAQPLPRPVAAVIIDLNKPLPASINLTTGQNLVIENGAAADISVKDTDSKGELLETRPKTAAQRAAYRAKRAGEGELTITYTVQAPGHKPMKPVTLKVTVRKLTPNPVVVQMSKQLPQKITLEKGQKVNFHIKGTEEAVFQINTNSKLLKTAPTTPGNGTIRSFEATDAGNAEIEVTVTTDMPGARPRVYKITVEITAP